MNVRAGSVCSPEVTHIDGGLLFTKVNLNYKPRSCTLDGRVLAHLEQHDEVERHAYEAHQDLGQVAGHYSRVVQHNGVKHLQSKDGSCVVLQEVTC